MSISGRLDSDGKGEAFCIITGPRRLNARYHLSRERPTEEAALPSRRTPCWWKLKAFRFFFSSVQETSGRCGAPQQLEEHELHIPTSTLKVFLPLWVSEPRAAPMGAFFDSPRRAIGLHHFLASGERSSSVPPGSPAGVSPAPDRLQVPAPLAGSFLPPSRHDHVRAHLGMLNRFIMESISPNRGLRVDAGAVVAVCGEIAPGRDARLSLENGVECAGVAERPRNGGLLGIVVPNSIATLGLTCWRISDPCAGSPGGGGQSPESTLPGRWTGRGHPVPREGTRPPRFSAPVESCVEPR